MLSIYSTDLLNAVEIVQDLNGKYISSQIVNIDPGVWNPKSYTK